MVKKDQSTIISNQLSIGVRIFSIDGCKPLPPPTWHVPFPLCVWVCLCVGQVQALTNCRRCLRAVLHNPVCI